MASEWVQEACRYSWLLEGKGMCAGKELSQSADKYFNTGSCGSVVSCCGFTKHPPQLLFLCCWGAQAEEENNNLNLTLLNIHEISWDKEKTSVA